MVCRFCGDEISSDDLLHALHCDGRQGTVEEDDVDDRHDDGAAERYPEVAGWKEPTTSRESAETVDARTLRQAVRVCLRTYGAMTPDECAGRMGMSILAIRPRFSELRATDEIIDTGERHRNRSGKRAIVWTLVPQERPCEN